jgi:hypothetical protein
MSVDSLNSRQTVPKCLQLTPEIALSVVPAAFGYNMYNTKQLRLYGNYYFCSYYYYYYYYYYVII